MARVQRISLFVTQFCYYSLYLLCLSTYWTCNLNRKCNFHAQNCSSNLNLLPRLTAAMVPGSYLMLQVLSGPRHFLTNERPLKKMKNVFCFMLKASFVVKVFKFLSWIFGHLGKLLDRKLALISIFMVSQTRQQIITIHMLPNISWNKANEIWPVNRI